jgi:hypothetical protein
MICLTIWLRGRATAVTSTLILRLFKNQLRQTTQFALRGKRDF